MGGGHDRVGTARRRGRPGRLVASFGVVSGNDRARWFGIRVAAVNAVGQLLYLPSYPLWAMALFALDILIIHALAVHGGPRPEDLASG